MQRLDGLAFRRGFDPDPGTAHGRSVQLHPLGSGGRTPRFFAHAPYLDHKRFDVCVEIDSRYRAQVRAALQQAAIPIAGQPAASIAPEGGTHADYRHESPDDFLHAGAAYGRLAMTEVLALAATMDA